MCLVSENFCFCISPVTVIPTIWISSQQNFRTKIFSGPKYLFSVVAALCGQRQKHFFMASVGAVSYMSLNVRFVEHVCLCGRMTLVFKSCS
jgi:hypothetical protein